MQNVLKVLLCYSHAQIQQCSSSSGVLPYEEDLENALKMSQLVLLRKVGLGNFFHTLLTEKKGHKETVINPPALGFLSKVFVEVWIKLLIVFFVINLCSKPLL